MNALSLEYHDVVPADNPDASGFPGRGSASYKLSTLAFAEHLEAIARVTARTPTRVIDWTASPADGWPLFLTFDDGGISAHSEAADLLERRGWRGHFFVTGGHIGTPTFLSPAQIRELRDRGHVIGAHSFTHPARMGALPRTALNDEWRRSTEVLANILGEPTLTASVPGGFYTPPVAEAAAAAGIKYLFTSAPSTRGHIVDGCRVMGRYTLRQWSPAATAGALANGNWGPRLSQWALYSALTLARTIAGDHYTRLRDRYWAMTRS